MPFFQDDPQVVAPRSLEGATRAELQASADQYQADELMVWQGSLLILAALAWFAVKKWERRRDLRLRCDIAPIDKSEAPPRNIQKAQ